VSSPRGLDVLRCVSDTLGVAETRGQKSDARDAWSRAKDRARTLAPMAANVFRQVVLSQRT